MITRSSSALDAVKQGGQAAVIRHTRKLLQVKVGGSGHVVAPARYIGEEEWREWGLGRLC